MELHGESREGDPRCEHKLGAACVNGVTKRPNWHRLRLPTTKARAASLCAEDTEDTYVFARGHIWRFAQLRYTQHGRLTKNSSPFWRAMSTP